MRRFLRWALIGGSLLLLGLGAAYGYFLHYPAPQPPQLSASIKQGSIQVGEMRRDYLFYAPAQLARNPAIVIALHGSTSNAEQMRQVTGYGFERLADEHGFLVIYPEGYERHWNDCRKQAPYAAKRSAIDDVGFMRALTAHFRGSYGDDDSAPVYVVGYSNGAHLAYRLTLEAPGQFPTVAAVAANLPTEENFDCTPAPGISRVLILNGTADPINPYEGGRVTLYGFADRGNVRSALETATYFASRNAISEAPRSEEIPPQGSGETSAQRTRWLSATGAEVVLYTIHGGGHTLPQPGARFPRLLGRTHQQLDGPAEIWAFFERRGSSP